MGWYCRERSADTLTTAWFLVPRRPDCHSGFALDFPGNRLLDDEYGQSKEKGLG